MLDHNHIANETVEEAYTDENSDRITQPTNKASAISPGSSWPSSELTLGVSPSMIAAMKAASAIMPPPSMIEAMKAASVVMPSPFMIEAMKAVSPILPPPSLFTTEIQQIMAIAPALGISQHINELTRPIQEISQHLIKNHAFLNELASSMKLTQEFLSNIERTNKYQSQRLLAAFKEANLWPSPSMTVDLIYQIAELVERGDKRPVVLCLWNYYSRDGYSKLKDAITQWWDDPGFVARRVTIEQAFEAYKQKWYALSIPALLPLVEGITGDFLYHSRLKLRASNGRPLRLGNSGEVVRLIMEEMARAGNVGNGGIDVEHYVMVKASLLFVEQVSYQNGDFTTQYDTFRMRRALHRHATLHGVQINYDYPMSSLRCFLLLDALHGIRKRYAMIKGPNSLQ